MATDNGWIGSRTLDVETLDGKVYRVRTIFADAIAYESTAKKHNWGPARDAGMQSLAFVCWHALKRTGETSAVYEQFRDTIVRVRTDVDDDADQDDAGPTLPGPPPG